MAPFSQIKFDGKDIVKLIGFLIWSGSMWYDLKSEQVRGIEDRKFLQYQINELKRTTEFVKPEPPSIITYRSHTPE